MQVGGKLFSWFETGLEGMVWSLQQDGTVGYDGLFIIEEGDRLIISSPSGQVLFDDYIVMDTGIGKELRPFSQMVQPQAKDLWIHWTQKGFIPDNWVDSFISEANCGLLTKKLGWIRP